MFEKRLQSRSPVIMDSLPAELWLKIFCLLDERNLVSALQVCRRWKVLASDDNIWWNLFKERWGENQAEFYRPLDSKSWKETYQVQYRRDRFGPRMTIIREGGDCYLIHQGQILRRFGTVRQSISCSSTEEDGESWAESTFSLGTWSSPRQTPKEPKCCHIL